MNHRKDAMSGVLTLLALNRLKSAVQFLAGMIVATIIVMLIYTLFSSTRK